MKIILCFVVAIVAVSVVHGGNGRNVCRVTQGKRMMQFSHDKLRVKFPCKYPAVRHSICGNWKVLLTPGNDYSPTKSGKRHDIYTRTLWLGLTNVQTNKTWKGRSDLTVAKKWLAGSKDYPFVRKQGDIDTAKFNFSSRDDEQRVSITTEDGDVEVTFFLYYGANAWTKESGFRFVCHSQKFEPSEFPRQLCGSGTPGEAKDYRKSHNMNQHEAILFSVFTTKGIAQTNTYCKKAENTMLNDCKSDEDRNSAIQSCWKFAIKGKVRGCVRRNDYEPMDVFNTCLDWVCKGSPCGEDSEELLMALNGCENMDDLTTAVKKCHDDLQTEYCTSDPVGACK